MATYSGEDFEQIAAAIGKDVADVVKQEKLFDRAAQWYALDCGLPLRDRPRPRRTSPSRMRIKLHGIAKSADRLLKHLEVHETEDAYGGPGNSELLETMAWAENYDEDAVVTATRRIGRLMEILEAIKAASTIDDCARKAADEVVAIGKLTVRPGGSCGGGFSKISQSHYGCSTARNKGTCDNLLSIRRDELESKVLDGLRRQLMHPEMVTTFIDEFRKEVNRQRAEKDSHRHHIARDLEKTERELRRLIEAIKSGVPGATLKDEMTALEARRVDLLAELEAAPPPMPRLHPNLAELYRQKVMNLAEALNIDQTRPEATECLRALIEEIRLIREEGKLRIELYGELASLVNLANGNPRFEEAGVQVTLVAGVGFEPTTFRL